MSKIRLAGELDPQRSMMIALVIGLLLAWSGPASAQQGKCLAGKTKCMAKKATGLLKCETLAETPGKPADPDAGGCSTNVKSKFDGSPDPTKGCFEKLENKNPNDCITFDDTVDGENAVDACVASLVSAIDPPPLTQTKCGAGKKKCVSKYLKSLLKCRQLSQTPGKSTDPNAGGCVEKAQAKYTGGLDPTKGCFAKLEATNPNDCQITGDSQTLEDLVGSCDTAFVGLLTATTTTSSTTTSSTSSTTSTTCPPPMFVKLKGALPPTLGRFNYNMAFGLPAANAFCATKFALTHACSYAELQVAAAACDLPGLTDINNQTVHSFWAIDDSAPPLTQCNDDGLMGSMLNWEYQTAHTGSRGNRVQLNPDGTLGTLSTGNQCNLSGTSNVGCCVP